MQDTPLADTKMLAASSLVIVSLERLVTGRMGETRTRIGRRDWMLIKAKDVPLL